MILIFLTIEKFYHSKDKKYFIKSLSNTKNLLKKIFHKISI